MKVVITLLVGILIAIVTHRILETCLTVNGPTLGLFIGRIGKLTGILYSYRPNRLYLRIG